jgi:succinate dehydrogenase/fumarate reductase cytochrome b subunit
MFSPTKRILEEYIKLVVHIFDEHAFNVITKANLELLCDIEIFICLTCVKYHFLNACRTFPSLDESTLMVNHFCSKKMLYNKYYSMQ